MPTPCSACEKRSEYIPTNQFVTDGRQYFLCSECWPEYRALRIKVIGERAHRSPDREHRFPLRDGDFPGQTLYLTDEEMSVIDDFFTCRRHNRQGDRGVM